MPGMFPQLSSFLDPKQRYKNPELRQVMPQSPTMAQPMMGGMMGQQPMPGRQRQQVFNQQQQDMNRGMVGGRMNRRRF